MKTEKPIYTFPILKRTLKRLGYSVEKAEVYRPIKPVDISIKEIKNGTIEITEDGIFFKTPDGQRHKGFMYKREYHLQKYGKPRFHLCNCTTILSFKQRGTFKTEYRWSNEETVRVLDMDDGLIDKPVGALPFCQYCAEIMRDKNIDYRSSNELVQELKSLAPPITETDVDILGYTKDWESISRTYRERRHFTCERCGICITNLFDRRFIHCHHRNGNKLDNRDSNLECLCIECHSKVNKAHEARFARGAKHVMLSEFKRKYHK